MNNLRKKIKVKDIIKLATEREKKGIKEYGLNSYKENDMWIEIIQELLDNINYSYLQILRILEANQKLRSLYGEYKDVNDLLGDVIEIIKANKKASK